MTILPRHHLETVDLLGFRGVRTRLRRYGRLAILAFCVKGIVSTTLIVTAFLKATGDL